MAHFMGGVEGNRGPASRLGSKDSGLEVYANGWELGVEVQLHFDGEEDIAVIYLTGGSGGGRRVRIGRFTKADLNEA